jgi:uncharacterized LabA/DUF88 family protein
MAARPRAYAYVDGFNLYYGLLKRHRPQDSLRLKWLDIPRWLRTIAKRVDPVHVRYFTARVTSPPHDPDRSERQDRYLRSLATLPGVSIHYGHFLEKTVVAPLAGSWPHSPQFVKVTVPEEKGSAVNLAVFLLKDAMEGLYDVALIISNDSDLAGAIEMVRRTFQKEVWVLSPHRRPSYALRRVATKYAKLRIGPVAACQLPEVVRDALGNEIRRPSSW